MLQLMWPKYFLAMDFQVPCIFFDAVSYTKHVYLKTQNNAHVLVEVYLALYVCIVWTLNQNK